MNSRFLLNQNFRQGSLYTLTEWNQLSPFLRELISALHDESEIYGAFEPLTYSPELTFKVAYREIAALYLHLQYSNRLPHYFILSHTQDNNAILAQLLFQQIIQIEWEGGYVDGPGALPVIYGKDVFEEQYPDLLSEISFKAIHYAWMLEDTDLVSIAGRLYSFNTIPWDAAMKSAFKNEPYRNIEEFIMSRMDTPCRQILEEDWHASYSETKEWLSWNRKSSKGFRPTGSSHTHKLYISPHINDFPEVFPHVVSTISDSEAFSFKVGNTLPGLLRPDKLVAYFCTQEALFKTASLLKARLAGYHPQGVPFSAQLDENGLISYGADPPESDVLTSIEAGSWRTYITDQLAQAILQAKKNQLNWQQTMCFIRATLLTAGIDSYHWRGVNEFSKTSLVQNIYGHG